MLFSIESIIAQAARYLGADDWEVVVTVKMPAKHWKKIRDKKGLGQLYGIEISNTVYAINRNIPAHHPTVDDRGRAKRGIKTITLRYKLQDPNRAMALGLKLLAGKYADYNDYIRIA